MMKWIGRSIYVLAIVFISVIIYRYAYTAKLQEYYDAEIRDNINDDETLLIGLNTLLTIDYYRESPMLYQYVSDTGDYQFTLSSYAIGITYGDVSYDGLMFVINNLAIMEDGELIVDPVLKITVNLSHNTLLVEDEYSNMGSVYYDPLIPFSIYNVPALFLFDAENYLLIPNDDDNASPEYATIENITLEYSNGAANDDNEYLFNEIPLFVGSKVEYRDAAYLKDSTFNIDPDLYQINDDFGSDGLSTDNIATFNLVTEQDDLTPYNGAIWRIMVIYILLIIVITYFLFFHKMLMGHLQYKKRLADKEITVKNPEVIFKDIDTDTKDGK
ncbi:hypothetical protein [Mariniplasma anaerobium]|uniref:Uncharacterized protein n=1 Tax=Mariniplasma anaerobium TaxID=2735436 RepID=A0A7U9XUW6_9MOLU|nr:hypothetical protein [Mariniplasma anaerobium]BCR36593.1 hypothetical protein MPAN_014860 [Mariniplasma anaerobium]